MLVYSQQQAVQISYESGAGALSKGIKSYTENEAKIAAGIKKLNNKVSGMSNLELPSDTELKAVKKASSALESDAKKLQESAAEIQSAIDKMNKLSEAVEAHNSKIENIIKKFQRSSVVQNLH